MTARAVASALGPCRWHEDPACARCYGQQALPAQTARALELHEAAERAGAVRRGDAWRTALVYRLHPPTLVGLRALVRDLARGLLKLRLDGSEVAAWVRALAAELDERLRRGVR